jgi:hypothetical protein
MVDLERRGVVGLGGQGAIVAPFGGVGKIAVQTGILTCMARELHVEGRLLVTEITGAWGVYAGERIMIGSGDSFRDDLGIKIRETFEAGAAEALRDGRSPSERFELGNVRVTIEVLGPG